MLVPAGSSRWSVSGRAEPAGPPSVDRASGGWPRPFTVLCHRPGPTGSRPAPPGLPGRPAHRCGTRSDGGGKPAGHGHGRLRPPPPADPGQLVQQGDGPGVVVAGPGLDDAVGDHAVEELAALVGADDGERPVVEGADAAGGDVGVLGGEVGARRCILRGSRRGASLRGISWYPPSRVQTWKTPLMFIFLMSPGPRPYLASNSSGKMASSKVFEHSSPMDERQPPGHLARPCGPS